MFFVNVPGNSLDHRMIANPVNPGAGTLTPNVAGSPTLRHFDSANLTFADGHVKWLKGYPETVGANTFFRPKKDGLDYDGDGNVGVGTTLG